MLEHNLMETNRETAKLKEARMLSKIVNGTSTCGFLGNRCCEGVRTGLRTAEVERSNMT